MIAHAYARICDRSIYNEGFGMFVGLRESRYLQLPQDFIASHNLRGYCLSDIHLLNLLVSRLAVGSCGTIAHHHQYNKEFFQFTGLPACFPDIVCIDESKGFHPIGLSEVEQCVFVEVLNAFLHFGHDVVYHHNHRSQPCYCFRIEFFSDPVDIP